MGGGPTSTSAMEGSRSGGMESEAVLAAAEAGETLLGPETPAPFCLRICLQVENCTGKGVPGNPGGVSASSPMVISLKSL